MKSTRGEISDLGEGKIIIAEPFMQDDYFARSVILITDYHETGTIGFILNQPLKMNMNYLISDFPEFPGAVLLGGPVANETVHYLHTLGNLLPGAKQVLPGLYWGGDFQQLKFLIANDVVKPNQIRFYVGYSGWSPGQLEKEMEETKAWLVSQGDPNYVFYDYAKDDLWQMIMSHKGDTFEIIAEGLDDLNVN